MKKFAFFLFLSCATVSGMESPAVGIPILQQTRERSFWQWVSCMPAGSTRPCSRNCLKGVVCFFYAVGALSLLTSAGIVIYESEYFRGGDLVKMSTSDIISTFLLSLSGCAEVAIGRAFYDGLTHGEEIREEVDLERIE